MTNYRQRQGYGQSVAKHDPLIVRLNIVELLFLRIFIRAEDESIKGEPELMKAHNVAALSEALAANIPERKLTPAEIQGFLLVNRQSPVAAAE
ncbi:hypothetical protein LTR66_007757 [Elasticomyces elasticus]|nr:hypothetical protein LTR50_005438 [Elasticomyces elasticus]KAK4986812.1 hypothetical protein LTR66_007757 [Elasticomyces elasticus]